MDANTELSKDALFAHIANINDTAQNMSVLIKNLVDVKLLEYLKLNTINDTNPDSPLSRLLVTTDLLDYVSQLKGILVHYQSLLTVERESLELKQTIQLLNRRLLAYTQWNSKVYMELLSTDV